MTKRVSAQHTRERVRNSQRRHRLIWPGSQCEFRHTTCGKSVNWADFVIETRDYKSGSGIFDHVEDQDLISIVRSVFSRNQVHLIDGVFRSQLRNSTNDTLLRTSSVPAENVATWHFHNTST